MNKAPFTEMQQQTEGDKSSPGCRCLKSRCSWSVSHFCNGCKFTSTVLNGLYMQVKTSTCNKNKNYRSILQPVSHQVCVLAGEGWGEASGEGVDLRLNMLGWKTGTDVVWGSLGWKSDILEGPWRVWDKEGRRSYRRFTPRCIIHVQIKMSMWQDSPRSMCKQRLQLFIRQHVRSLTVHLSSLF